MDHSADIVFPVLFFAAGIASFYVARYFDTHFRKRHAAWDEAKAIVTGISVQSFGDGFTRSYYPKYRYSYRGREYTGTPTIGRRQDTHQVGDTVGIVVNPSNPAESDLPYSFRIGSTALSAFDLAFYLLRVMSIVFLAVGVISAALFLLK